MNDRGIVLLIALGSALVAAERARAEPTAPSRPAAPELVVIVNPQASVTRLSGPELEAIFLSRRRSWPDGERIVPLNYAPDHDLRRRFDAVVLGMTPEQIGRYWVDQRIRGGARPPRQVPDPALAVRLVAKLPGAVAFVPAESITAGVRVVARVRGNKITDP